MAPEQADGAPVDHRCDLYGLGCVLYRSCTGQLPYEGHSAMDVFFAQRTETPKHPCAVEPSVPPALGDLIMGLLAKEPAARPQSAAAVRDALRAMQTGPPPEAPHPAAAPTVETAALTREQPALPKSVPAPAPANPWADVVSGPREGSAARSASTGRTSLVRRWGGPRLRWLVALLAASLGLLLFLIVLGLRH
jgi:serine/threonine protein kinase